jgi:hypothetical protein
MRFLEFHHSPLSLFFQRCKPLPSFRYLPVGATSLLQLPLPSFRRPHHKGSLPFACIGLDLQSRVVFHGSLHRSGHRDPATSILIVVVAAWFESKHVVTLSRRRPVYQLRIGGRRSEVIGNLLL